MALIGWSEFRNYLGLYRVAAIIGRLGSGKTLLSVAIAHRLMLEHSVLRVWCNFPVGLEARELPDNLEELDKPTIKALMSDNVFLLDEAWDFADSRKSANDYSGYGAYVRKLRSYFIGASVYPPDKRMRAITVNRVMSVVGLGWWVYQYLLFDNSTKGMLILTNPAEYFGTYDTDWIPEDDAGLSVCFNKLRSNNGIKKVVGRIGSRASVEQAI
ncbi:MAG TPA: hypothetical protein V6C97_27170 [Oculatellaceae cyanobacterium]